MIKFEYEVKDGSVCWSAIWDGRHDNEPLLSREPHGTEVFPHPFYFTLEYEDADREYSDFKKHARKEGDFYYYEWLGTERCISAEELEKDHPGNLRDIGDYAALNPVTEKLCELLSITNAEEMLKHSGNKDPYWYWMKLLAALSQLWD